MLRRKF